MDAIGFADGAADLPYGIVAEHDAALAILRAVALLDLCLGLILDTDSVEAVGAECAGDDRAARPIKER